MTGLTRRLKDAANRHSEYRRIVREIQSLSERDAADLGIYTHDAERIASKAVYGY